MTVPVGFMAFDMLIDSLRPFADYILPGVFGIFILGTVIALALTDLDVTGGIRFTNRWIPNRLQRNNRSVFRQLWLTTFFSGILVTTLIGAPILPFVEMNKYSDSTSEELTYYEIRMVDENGAEIRYDLRATPPLAGGSRQSRLGGMMVNEFSDEKRLEMSTFLFESAVEYRAEIERGESSWRERLEAPYYSQEPPWRRNELKGMSGFDSIKIYERTIVYGEDNTEIVNREDRERLRIDPSSGTIQERGEA